MTAIERTDVTARNESAWERVCDVDSIGLDRGVAVLVAGEPVALFRLSPVGDGGEEWRAVGHLDPVTAAPVMARGLVGSVGVAPLSIPTVASPLHKERYNLRTGVCLDDPTTRLETYDVRVLDGGVEISAVVTCPKPEGNEVTAE